jgi:hypothetical protein
MRVWAAADRRRPDAAVLAHVAARAPSCSHRSDPSHRRVAQPIIVRPIPGWRISNEALVSYACMPVPPPIDRAADPGLAVCRDLMPMMIAQALS